MPPKKNTTQIPEQGEEDSRTMMEMLRSITAQSALMSTQLADLTTKMSKMDTIETEIKTLKVLLEDVKNENKQLKSVARETEKKFTELNERNNYLENKMNSLEQHHRSWSARILNIPLSATEETDNATVINRVYTLALLPILRGAVERKLLPAVPSADQVLEVAHVLPSKAGQPKPVIMRFYSRELKDIIFKLKKHYAPREDQQRTSGEEASVPFGGARARERGASGASGGEEEQEAGGFEGKGRYIYPFYEDLIRSAFLKMRAIKNDSRVKSCWSVKGQIKFVLHSNTKDVRKVVSLLDPLDTILK